MSTVCFRCGSEDGLSRPLSFVLAEVIGTEFYEDQDGLRHSKHWIARMNHVGDYEYCLCRTCNRRMRVHGAKCLGVAALAFGLGAAAKGFTPSTGVLGILGFAGMLGLWGAAVYPIDRAVSQFAPLWRTVEILNEPSQPLPKRLSSFRGRFYRRGLEAAKATKGEVLVFSPREWTVINAKR